MPNNKKIIFSATAPSGNIHIGNYIGAIKQWAELQNTGEHQNIFCVVDEHAITTPQEPAKLRSKILEVFTLYLALGIDPEKSIIFVQSSVSEHTELAWILNTITPIGELERMTQFKDKSQKQKSVLAGLLNYPTLMAADILLYKTNLVPIGEDQLQHIELTRMIARKFNSTFGETFAIPEPFINKEGKKKKKKKKKPHKTNTTKKKKYEKKNKPAISNLLTIYSLFSRKTIAEL